MVNNNRNPMGTNKKNDIIEVWRTEDFSQLELYQGIAVARTVPRHWHQEYQLCLIQAGVGNLSYRGSTHLTPTDSLFIVHPGEVHSNYVNDSWGCSYRMFLVDPELMLASAREINPKELNLPFFPKTIIFDQDILKRYLALHTAFEQPLLKLEREFLLINFLTTLISRHSEQRPQPRKLGQQRQAIRRVQEYLTECYSQQISLDELANIANLSPFHFHRVFTEQTGMPPHAFQTQIRICQAQILLRQGWSITQVAMDTGFADQSHLHRYFKRILGVTPGQFIQNSKNVQDLG